MNKNTWRLVRNPLNKIDLNLAVPQDLSTFECEILYWADRALTLAEIATKTGHPVEDVLAAVDRFEAHEIARASDVTEAQFSAKGRPLTPRAEQTLDQLWNKAATTYADRRLFVYAADESEFTYGDAQQGVERVAQALVKAGLKKGDIIAADADLNPEFALLFWAAMLRGLVVAPLNTTLPDATTTDVIRECDAKLVFTQSRRAAGRDGVIVFDSSVDENARPGGKLFSEWMDLGEETVALPSVSIAESDVASLIFTSGTTGLPKAVQLSHGALYRSAQNLTNEYAWTKDDVLLIPGEFNSIGGLRSPLVAVLHVGASFVLTTAAQRRHPLSLLPVLQQTGTTILNITPAFLIELGKGRERMPNAALPTVRLVLSTAAPLTPAAAVALKPFPHIKLGNYYGLTETTGACIYAHAVDTTGTAPWEAGLVGKPNGIIVHIVDEDGKRLPPGQVGEVCLYSENLMSGYLNNPTEAAQVLQNGWLHTGDLGLILPDGQIALKGRKREIIKDDFGDIISPLEIEAVIGQAPGVEEVAVSGFTDPESARESLVVFVVPAPSADAAELIPSLKERVLDSLGVRKVPKNFHIVSTLPRNSNGKVLKRELIETYLTSRKEI